MSRRASKEARAASLGRESKPRCCWERVAGNYRRTRRLRNVGPCKARACFDWPVCRQHLEAWANENPLEVAKRRPVVTARLNMRAESMEFDRVTIVCWVGGWRGYPITLVLEAGEALTVADWYEHHGDERSALVIRYRALDIEMRGHARRVATLRSILARIHQVTP